MINIILKAANDLMAFKKSLGYDASPWTPLDVLTQIVTARRGTVILGNGNDYPIIQLWDDEENHMVTLLNGKWVSGWI